MTEINRRSAVTVGLAAAALSSACVNAATNETPKLATTYMPRPLPFNPANISGLSETLIRSHHEKNYAGAVRRLGAIQTKLAGLDPTSEPGFVMNGLKREELMALNSMILHEIYFDGFNDKKSPSEKLGGQIEKDFGSLDKWGAEFTSMAKALGGGSGWVLLSWSPRTGRLMNIWAADHTHSVGDGQILLALDMYEHAYAMDFGANTKAYVKAFMAVQGWQAADKIFAQSQS